ncbi:MAG: sterol desaturase family protein, partial [Bacteroidota bacterium]|nr:sterol desaturase family protein [Bacteroidota bacterium]MDX5430432.1 sterol desaturase family protein [Bacteroidota bacterium]MDX5469191.1 sterol desaturase family protein [Bacteroidota bacterium]
VHSNHHSSPNYNFAVALRSSVFQPFYRFLFYIPVAFLGFDGLTIMFVFGVNQFYQFWLHTETIPKLPRWIEYIFVTPSHHRVHHASNIRYLDRNMGQVLILWDRLFGTFQSEVEEDKPNYGLTKPLENHHPIRSVLHEFYLLKEDLGRSKGVKQRLKYLFAAPGWSHDGKTKTAKQLRSEMEQND